MYTLQRLNVVKTVPTEAKRDELLSKGFTLISEDVENKSAEKKEKPLEKMKLDELKALAAAKEIDITGLETKGAILAKIQEAEQEK